MRYISRNPLKALVTQSHIGSIVMMQQNYNDKIFIILCHIAVLQHLPLILAVMLTIINKNTVFLRAIRNHDVTQISIIY